LSIHGLAVDQLQAAYVSCSHCVAADCVEVSLLRLQKPMIKEICTLGQGHLRKQGK